MDQSTGQEQPADFRCDVSYSEDRAAVRVQGEVDLATAPTLLREVRAALRWPLAGISVDLRSVTFIDSSGIAALIEGRRAAEGRGVAFELVAVPPQPRKVLELTGLAELFGLIPSTTA